MATITETTGLTGTSRSTYTGAMKEQYVQMLDPLMHDPEQKIAGLIARNRGQTMGGRKTVMSVAVQRPQGVGHRGEGFTAPWKGAGSYINPELTPKKLVIRHGQTAEAILDSRGGDKVAWGEAMGMEMELLRTQLMATWIRNLYYGRADILGVVSAVGAGTVTIQGRNARGGTAAQFFRRGAINDPFYEGMYISFIPAANGAFGSPLNVAATAIGDPTTAFTLQTQARRIATNGIDMTDPTAPILTLDATVAGTVNVGDLICSYGSRRASVNADANSAITDIFGMEGIGSYNVSQSICGNIYGYSKSSYNGLRAQYKTNPAGVGTPRQWDTPLADLLVRAGLTASGKTVNTAVMTPAQLTEVFKAERNLRRLEPVMGKQGGDSSTMAYLWHGINLAILTDWMAIPNAVIGVNPDLYEYWENYALGAPPGESGKRFVIDTDSTEELYIKRGNVACFRPFSVSMIDDLIEDEYNLT